jgi:integrase
MALTDTGIKAATAKEKAYPISDGGGLYLWVTPAGGKLWRWAYRFDGKMQLMSFGKYPDVGLAAVRERHRAARSLLATGVNPMVKRKTDKVAKRTAADNSFQNIALLWLAHWRIGKSERHAEATQRRLNLDVFPAIGSMPITEIEAPALVALALKIQARGAVDIAKRALITMGQIFKFAIAHGYAKRNPAKDFSPSDILQAQTKTNLARIDAKELPKLLRAIEAYHGNHITRFAIKLMALTFVRTTELIGAKWAEFDLEARRWDIPAERMKMKTPHIVALSTQAIEALETLHVLTGNRELLFPSERGDGKTMSNNTILGALKRMGYQGQMTGHGFRGLASTILHEQGYNHEHIELQLAHTNRNAVSAAYNHALYLEPRAKMMQDWANYLDLTRQGARVINFKRVA